MNKNLNFFIFTYILLNFDFSLSQEDKFYYFGERITPKKEEGKSSWANKETTKFSKTLDMGPCTCDLTNHCDYRCCCDPDCNGDEIVKVWKRKGICLNKNNNRMEKFKCDSRKNSFNFNKNEAGISIKDHIFNIMCIERDNNKDMGKFYLEEFNNNQVKEAKEKWLKDFFEHPESPESEERYEYGDLINNNINVFKSDSNGNCIRAKIYFLKPFESSCIYESEKELPQEGDQYGNGLITEISYVLQYQKNEDSTYSIIRNPPKIMRMNNTQKLVKFKVIWQDLSYDPYKIPSTYGYLQGNPIKVAEVDGNNIYYYSNGFVLPSSNSHSKCISSSNINESINFNTILFKKDLMFSCRYDNLDDINIYNQCKKHLKIAPSADSSLSDFNSWIDLNSVCLDELDRQDIEIKLIILTSKEGKENEPYEYIKYARFFISNTANNNTSPTISFKVKFIDFSYSSIENSKNKKITSLIPLSKNIIEKLTDKSYSS